jgi:Lrp/AsnC family leucine-responsive transcriptional regulator
MRNGVLTEQVSAVQARILKELIVDGRKSDIAIAKKIGLAKEVVKKNRGRMEQAGIITGATIHINYKSFGFKGVAHILINVDSKQADQLIEYLQKMPETYGVYSRGIKGNIDVITTLKTFEQLNEIKDAIKRHFSVLEMRTAIWTDVKEMNDNLAIIPDNRKNVGETINYQRKTRKKSKPETMVIDQIDRKIADKLSENGRVSMEKLGREMGISSDTAKRRYEKLKKNGVLKVTIQISPIKIGYQALCLFFTITSQENSLSIIEKISRIPDIVSIMKTTGDYDLQIWAMVQDIDQLLFIQEELGKIQGILRMDMEVVRVLEKWPTPRQYISTF